jgi:hypothetical protein
VVNPLAAIKFAASALRTSKGLTPKELADVRRTEKAAGLVVRMVEQLAALPDATVSAGAEKGTTDLYVLCCELVARRQTDGHTIHCRAFGDPRGRWDRRRVAGVVSRMLDRALAHIGKRSTLNVAVTGMKRHVRVVVHGLGFMNAKRRQACIEFPATVTDKVGGSLSATVSSNAGTVFTLRLPR